MNVLSQHGETLDQVCWRALGTTVPVEQVYALNPGVAALGPTLPDATPLVLPDLPPATAAAPLRETVELWS